jgi:probable H4MPT-linked C1 transfer pathway protein
VQRRGDQRTVTAGIGEPRQILRPSNAAAGHERQPGRRLAHAVDEREVEPRAGADARQIDHDHGGGAGVGGTGGHDVGRGAGWDVAARHDGIAVAQVEAESDPVATHRLADLCKRLVGGERLERDDHTRRPEAERLVRAIGGRHRGIEPERRTQFRDCRDERVRGPVRGPLRRTTRSWTLTTGCQDRIEVGDVQLPQAEEVDISARQRQRVAGSDGRAGDGLHEFITLAHPRSSVHGATCEQIDDANYSHGVLLCNTPMGADFMNTSVPRSKADVATDRGVIGWDIGGVNTKVARVAGGEVAAVRWRPYELQRAPRALTPLMRELAVEVGASVRAAHGVTMTAELSQLFCTKREGVAFVLDAVEAAFPSSVIRVYAVDGRWLAPEQARQEPLAVAAANWSATAHLVAAHHPDVLLIDIGTTTTDVIPIVGGAVAAEGHTDPERLASGELVYTGALRTPAEAMASHVPFGGMRAGVSAEGFALAGDVHVWRGELAPADYTCPTPDGRPPTREFAGTRLARVVCADRELLDEAAVSSIADALAGAQVARIAAAIEHVLARHSSLGAAVVTGLGAFLGRAAAHAVGLPVVPLVARLGEEAGRCAPAASVALLLERTLMPAVPREARLSAAGPIVVTRAPGVEVVVKLGGGVLAHAGHFETALRAIAAASLERRLLVVPGGGPFAGAVREVDRRLRLPDDAAHWMAVLAMDQYAHVVAARLAGGLLVADPREMASAPGGLVPVLAPSRWLREADPLPHSWEVTSDSIAAWVAGAVGARRLVLVKPPGAVGGNLVDGYFSRALPADVTPVIVAADQVDALRLALRQERV